MENKFNITRKDETLTWQTMIERISLGFELQKLSGEITEDQILAFNDAIVIAPDYQREYRSSVSDESSLIESALLEIPIPPIFLASHKYKGVQVLNVVDGQHRLRAFYRYFNNDYALKDLKILTDFNGKTMSDVAVADKVELMSRTVNSITFRNFPGKQFELEIFNRYNKGTKPLTQQEIRHAVFGSKTNDMINDFCSLLMKEPKSLLGKAYAISKDRFQKKSCQENIFVILSILEHGVNQSHPNEKGIVQKLTKSPQYAESYMRFKSEEESDEQYEATKSLFDRFNIFIEKLASVTEYPFSRELYGVSVRGNKFQVSLSMILAGVFNKLVVEGADIENLNIRLFRNYTKEIINNSYLEDPNYKASTTNPLEIEALINSFNFQSE